MKKLTILLFVLSFSTVSFLEAQISATASDLRAKHFNYTKSGHGIMGYDPMSYFLGKPEKGNTAYSFNYNGTLYKFASARNLELFKLSPEKFEPCYGGWCAYAMGATGDKVEIDPGTYKIVNGKLYLFYNASFNNTLPKWNADEKNLNKKADLNWRNIYK